MKQKISYKVLSPREIIKASKAQKVFDELEFQSLVRKTVEKTQELLVQTYFRKDWVNVKYAFEELPVTDKGDFGEANQEKIIEAAANILRKHKFEVDEHLDCKHPLYNSKT